jgi:hypothetical protein
MLLFSGQSAAILFDFPSFPFKAIFPGIFPLGYVQPPPVRIYSRQNHGIFYRPKVAGIPEISFLSPGSDKI